MDDEDRKVLRELLGKYGLWRLWDEMQMTIRNMDTSSSMVRGLDLSIRTKNALMRHGVVTVDQAIDIAMHAGSWSVIKHFGEVGWKELRAALAKKGYINNE